MVSLNNRGSGFPAANRFFADSANSGWKAAPTIELTPKIISRVKFRAP